MFFLFCTSHLGFFKKPSLKKNCIPKHFACNELPISFRVLFVYSNFELCYQDCKKPIFFILPRPLFFLKPSLKQNVFLEKKNVFLEKKTGQKLVI